MRTQGNNDDRVNPGRSRWRQSLLAATMVSLAAVVVAPGSVEAAPAAEVLMDCNREGDEYLFPQTTVVQYPTAWVTDAAGGRVADAEVQTYPGYWRVDVPPNTTYTRVWISDETNTASVAGSSPDCTPTAVSLSTGKPGAGLIPVPPQRLYDTRKSGDRLSAGKIITVAAAGRGGVPADAKAVMVNVTAVVPSGPGHVTVFPCVPTRPQASMLNYVSGETRAGSTLVKLDGTGRFCVYSHAATDIVVDVQGYTTDATNPVAITPTRVLDTRRRGRPLTGTERVDLKLSTLGLPFNVGVAGEEVAGVFLNVTSAMPSAPGHLTVYPGNGSGDGSTSRVNFEPGRAQANLVYTTIDNGKIDIMTITSTDVIVDVVAVATHPNSIVPVGDVRVLDTRTDSAGTTDGRLEGIGRLRPGVPVQVPITGRLGPLTPTDVLLNVTGVTPSATTHVTVYPCGGDVPNASNVNIPTGKVIPNSALVPIGDAGSVCVFSPVETDLVIDVVGAMTSRAVGLYRSDCVTTIPLAGDTIVGGTPPYTITGKVPAGFKIIASGGGFLLVRSDAAKVIWDGYLTVADADGKSIRVDAGMYPFITYAPRPPC